MIDILNIKLTGEKTGKINELHSVNCAPYTKSAVKSDSISTDLVDRILGYAKSPHSRLHDMCGIFGGCYFVDVPNIFRNFDADENDENNYDFHYTDECIKCILHAGTKIYYRLGITIEWGSKKYTCYPPKDNLKWARICEHIIRHYNEGWANGYHFDIEYWEIWNEPENPPMWQGTREEFFELYKVASRHLKTCFPNLKIGGYGSCGFYAVFEPERHPFWHGFVEYFEKFLILCKEENLPLDFYSWHIYTNKISDVVASAEYVRKKLDEYGFKSTESHLNEWNFGHEGKGFMSLESLNAAAFCTAFMIKLQELGVEMAMYYDLNIDSSYNGFINLRTNEFTPVIHPFAAYGRLFDLKNELKLEFNKDENSPYILAAGNENEAAVLLTGYNKENLTLKLDLKEYKGKKVTLYRLKDEKGFIALSSFEIIDDIIFNLSDNFIYYIAITDNENSEILF